MDLEKLIAQMNETLAKIEALDKDGKIIIEAKQLEEMKANYETLKAKVAELEAAKDAQGKELTEAKDKINLHEVEKFVAESRVYVAEKENIILAEMKKQEEEKNQRINTLKDKGLHTETTEAYAIALTPEAFEKYVAGMLEIKANSEREALKNEILKNQGNGTDNTKTIVASEIVLESGSFSEGMRAVINKARKDAAKEEAK